jgi:predicted anti-sigma-YlaC factor YlaD
MSDTACKSFAELLVAYADGDLSGAEAERVAGHLAECAGCRSELRLLRRSLELARQVWRESAARARRPQSAPIRRLRWRRVAAACAAAAVLVLGLAAGYWFFWRPGPAGETARVEPPSPGAGSTVAGPTAEEEEAGGDLEEMIAREGRAARLAAAVELLATQPGLEAYRAEAEHYLEQTYGPRRSVHPHRAPIPN